MKTTNPGDLLVLLGIALGLFLVLSGIFEEWRRRRNTKLILQVVADHIERLREENRKTHAGLIVKVERLVEHARLNDPAVENRKPRKGKK